MDGHYQPLCVRLQPNASHISRFLFGNNNYILIPNGDNQEYELKSIG